MLNQLECLDSELASEKQLIEISPSNPLWIVFYSSKTYLFSYEIALGQKNHNLKWKKKVEQDKN